MPRFMRAAAKASVPLARRSVAASMAAASLPAALFALGANLSRFRLLGGLGVATGLAWTPTGGEILLVETSRMPGGGKFEYAVALRLLAAHRESAARERALRDNEDADQVLAEIDAKLDAMRDRARAALEDERDEDPQ